MFRNIAQKINEYCNTRFVRRRMSVLAPGVFPVWMLDYPNYLQNVTTRAKSTFTGHSGGQICQKNIDFIKHTKCNLMFKIALLVYKNHTKYISARVVVVEDLLL